MKKIIKIALVAGAACLAGKLLLSAVAPKIDVTVVADRWDPDPDTGKDEDDAPVDSAEQNAAPEPEAETSVSEEPAPAPESGESAKRMQPKVTSHIPLTLIRLRMPSLRKKRPRLKHVLPVGRTRPRQPRRTLTPSKGGKTLK